MPSLLARSVASPKWIRSPVQFITRTSTPAKQLCLGKSISNKYELGSFQKFPQANIPLDLLPVACTRRRENTEPKSPMRKFPKKLSPSSHLPPLPSGLLSGQTKVKSVPSVVENQHQTTSWVTFGFSLNFCSNLQKAFQFFKPFDKFLLSYETSYS